MLNEIETPEGEDTDLSEALEGNSSEKASEFLLTRSPPSKWTLKNSVLKKTIELFTGCSNQALYDVCQHYGNVTGAKLRNCNDSVRGVFLN